MSPITSQEMAERAQAWQAWGNKQPAIYYKSVLEGHDLPVNHTESKGKCIVRQQIKKQVQSNPHLQKLVDDAIKRHGQMKIRKFKKSHRKKGVAANLKRGKKTREKILGALCATNPISISEIVEKTGLSDPNIRHHMAIMHSHDMVLMFQGSVHLYCKKAGV